MGLVGVVVSETVAPVAECVFAAAAAGAAAAAAEAVAAAEALGAVPEGPSADSVAQDRPVEGSCLWR